MESRGPEDSKNVKTSQAYFFEGFISFFEDFSLTIRIYEKLVKILIEVKRSLLIKISEFPVKVEECKSHVLIRTLSYFSKWKR